MHVKDSHIDIPYGPFTPPRPMFWLMCVVAPLAVAFFVFCLWLGANDPRAHFDAGITLGLTSILIVGVAIPIGLFAIERAPLVIRIDLDARTIQALRSAARPAAFRRKLRLDEVRGIYVEHDTMAGPDGEVTKSPGGRIVFELADPLIPEWAICADGQMLGGHDAHLPAARAIASALALPEPRLVEKPAPQSRVSGRLLILIIATALASCAIGAIVHWCLRQT